MNRFFNSVSDNLQGLGEKGFGYVSENELFLFPIPITEDNFEFLLGFCELCEQPVHPANNLYLISDLIENKGYYRNGRAMHFLPVIGDSKVICNGSLNYSQFLLGNKRVKTEARIDPVESILAWEEAFQVAQELTGSDDDCFVFELNSGLWVQKYRCNTAEQLKSLSIKR